VPGLLLRRPRPGLASSDDPASVTVATVAELLRDAGYHTVFVVTGAVSHIRAFERPARRVGMKGFAG
jgi:hypothetical protein